jgi:hypothetical protein
MPDGNAERLAKQVATISLLAQADIAALLHLCDAVASKLGVTEIEGLAVIDWYNRQRRAELDRLLLESEDMNPWLGALLQQRIDEAKRRSSPPPGRE